MWVLDAWKNAEKITYQIIWEEVKDASNVIDYDIHDEITIDNSSVLNANNDTTTGMATVIPWVNAPKLKLSTSIYVDKLEIPSVWATLYNDYSFYRPDNASIYWRNFTVTDARWNWEITYYDSPKWTNRSWMKVPYEWTYQLDVIYPEGWTWFGYTVEFRTPNWWWSADTVWKTFVWPRNTSTQTESFKRDFAKWEVFWVFCKMDRSSSTPLSAGASITIVMTKL